MINIRIERDGRVSGDVNMVAAYDSDKYSQPIRILHPDFPHVTHKLKYRQGRIESSDIISKDDMTRFIVSGPGLVRMQYVAEDARTGIPVLTSQTFTLNVAKSNMKPTGEDPAHRLHGPSIMESTLNMITERLKDTGIILTSKVAAIYDCNKLVEDKEYLVGPMSLNTPDGVEGSLNAYLVRVKIADGTVIQTAHLLRKKKSSVFYRVGVIISEEAVEFSSWEPVFYNNSDSIQEGESLEDIPFNPGSYVVIKNEDNSYSLYYDTINGTSIEDRVLLVTSNTNAFTGAVVIQDDIYENNIYTVSCDSVEKPYDGMIAIFTPSTTAKNKAITKIRFNNVISNVLARVGSTLEVSFENILIENVPVQLVYLNNTWVVNSATTISNVTEVTTIVDSYDFETNTFKDSSLPETLERITNKVDAIEDATAYTINDYPTVNAVKAYVQAKLDALNISNGDYSRIVYSNAPSSVRDFIHVLMTYVDKSDTFTYGDERTALDNTCENQLNMVSLIELALRGIDYSHSKYAVKTNSRTYKYGVSISTESKLDLKDLIDYASNQGVLMQPENWDCVLPGDLIVTKDTIDIFLYKVDDRILTISYTDKFTVKYSKPDIVCEYAIRFPLNHVNDLYPINLAKAYEDVTLSANESVEIELDENLRSLEPYTIHITTLTGKDVYVACTLQGTYNSRTFNYKNTDSIETDIDIPIINSDKTDVNVIKLTNLSDNDVTLSGICLYEGLIDALTEYQSPISEKESSGGGNDIWVYN